MTVVGPDRRSARFYIAYYVAAGAGRLLSLQTFTSDARPTSVADLDLGGAAELIHALKGLVDKERSAFPAEGTATRVNEIQGHIGWPYPPELVDVLAEILGTYRDPNIRTSTAYLLARSSDPRVREIFLQVMRKEKDWFVLKNMLRAFAAVGLKQDAQYLVALDIPEAAMAFAAQTLCILGHPCAIPFIRNSKAKPSKAELGDGPSLSEAAAILEARPTIEALLVQHRAEGKANESGPKGLLPK
jgi:hypothetical protein